MSAQPDDNDKNLGILSRQEILTGFIFVVLGIVSVGAVVTLYFVFSSPDLVTQIEISGDVDVGKFVDKVVESYDAFLVLLGVGVGTAVAAVKAKRG